MAKEEIIKSLQRTRNDDGDMKVIFPITSADAVYYDIDKKITLADKLSTNDINDNSVTYYDVYNTASLGGTGALEIGLPDIKDNTIELDVNVGTGSMSLTNDITTLTVPTLSSSITVATPVISEMSDDGTFIFLSVVRNTTYTSRLYRTAQGSVIELPFALTSIVTPMRARFSRTNSHLIVYGTDSLGDTMIEVHRINAMNGSYQSSEYKNPVDFGNSISANITYFDTVLYNGNDYLITNNPATSATFACFRINGTTLTINNSAVRTSDTYIIENDFRVAPNSSRIAILSADSSLVYCMGYIGSGQFRFRTAGETMDQFAWGASSNNGNKIGKWRKISFNADGTKMYGTYVIGHLNTLRICDVSNTYGERTNSVKEISLKTDDIPFDIGLTVFKPIPKSTIYNSVATGADILGVGTFSQSTMTDQEGNAVYFNMSPVIRFSTSTLPTATSTVQYSTSPGNIIVEETGYFIDEDTITYNHADPSLMPTIQYDDVFIHPTNGYAYGVYSTIYDIPLTPIYLGQIQPEIRLSTNPSVTPIIHNIAFADISYDGNAIAYIDSSAIQRLRICAKVGDRYIHRSTTMMYLGVGNTILGCKIIDNGNYVLGMYDSGFKFFKFNGTRYVEANITYTGGDFLATNGHVYMSPTVINNSVHTWTSLRVEYVADDSVKLNIHRYTFSETSGLIITNTPIAEYVGAHNNVIGASFSSNGLYLSVITNDNSIVRIYNFNLVNNTFTLNSKYTLDDGYYASTSVRRNNCAMTEIVNGKSILVYANSNGIIRGLTLDWINNTAVRISTTSLGIPENSIYPCGIDYAYESKRLVIAKDIDGELYIYWYTNSKFELVELYNDTTAYNSKVFINDTGNILLAVDNYPTRSRLINVSPYKLNGNMKITARYTDNGWENVSIVSSNQSLQNVTRLAIDESGKTVILIGDKDTVWNPLHVDINSITITGPTAKKYSYRIGYDSKLATDTSVYTNEVTSTTMVTEVELTKRITIKSYVIEPSQWSSTPISGYYVCKIYNYNITQNTTVNININDLTNWSRAYSFGIIGLSVEHDGYVEIYAANRPNMSIIADIDIFM